MAPRMLVAAPNKPATPANNVRRAVGWRVLAQLLLRHVEECVELGPHSFGLRQPTQRLLLVKQVVGPAPDVVARPHPRLALEEGGVRTRATVRAEFAQLDRVVLGGPSPHRDLAVRLTEQPAEPGARARSECLVADEVLDEVSQLAVRLALEERVDEWLA